MDAYKLKEVEISINQPKVFTSSTSYIILLSEHTCYTILHDTKLTVTPSDLVFLKPNQRLTLYAQQNTDKRKLLYIRIPVKGLDSYAGNEVAVTSYFDAIPFSIGIIHSDQKSIVLLKNLFRKMTSLHDNDAFIAKELYQKGLFLSFISVFLRIQENDSSSRASKAEKTFAMDDLFQYISHHLHEDLSLQKLEQEFFLSGSHICREFKKATGLTLHSYITTLRIDLAKEYLLSGKSVQQLYTLCGFQSYNHFFKTFKKYCNMTPKEYQKKMLGS